MREIKFRYVLKNDKTGDIIVTPFEMDMKTIEQCGVEEVYEILDSQDKTGCSCFNEGRNHCECGSDFEDYEIIDRLQELEFKDIKGFELYEGCIIKVINRSFIGVVKFGQYETTDNFSSTAKIHYGFYIDWINDSFIRQDLLFWLNENSVKIIGNKFENKELLKDK